MEEETKQKGPAAYARTLRQNKKKALEVLFDSLCMCVEHFVKRQILDPEFRTVHKVEYT